MIIEFEHCWQFEQDSQKCETDENAIDFWKGNTIYVQDLQKFADVKDEANPLQWTSNFNIFPSVTNTSLLNPYALNFELQQNELTINDGIIGIFQTDPDPVTFLTTATVKKYYESELDVEIPKRGEVLYPFL